MIEKPSIRAELIEVFYDDKHWKLLWKLRSKAARIMEVLAEFHLNSIVHGSIARGDISDKSDIDVFVPDPPSSFAIEVALESGGFKANRRIIVQATPVYAVKGYIEIDKTQCVSFPLVKLRFVERDFYDFSGEISLHQLRNKVRVSGVNKRLMLIEPTTEGHIESSVVDQEPIVASLLGIPVEAILDRVHALIRRDKVGRTGVFVERELLPDETYEMALKRIASQNPAVRRRLGFIGKK